MTKKDADKKESGAAERLPKLEELQKLRVALVCDWLTNVGGAEKVILKIHQLFPDAPIYTSQYRPKKINWFKDADVRTGWMQRFPVKLRRILGPLRQIYFSRLDLSQYDLVISITGAEAKAVKAKNGVHISYCHVPTQYYWQMYDEYIKNPGFGILNPLIRFFFRLLVVPLRYADLHAAKAPDYFVTISEYAKEQIKKYYDREATVIHPPVELDDFRLKGKQPPIRLKDGYELSDAYVVTSRQVNWKHVDLAVRAAFLSQRHVLIIGEGPEHRQLVKMAKGSDLVQFLPLMKKEELAKYLNQARGFLFPSLEPFGIAPVEALAAGCPVVAFGEGGAKDYVVNGENGVLFEEQTPISLAEGILELEKIRPSRKAVSETAEAFGLERFDRELVEFIGDCEGIDVGERKAEVDRRKENEIESEEKGSDEAEKDSEEDKKVEKVEEDGKVKEAKKPKKKLKEKNSKKDDGGGKAEESKKEKELEKNKRDREDKKDKKVEKPEKVTTEKVEKSKKAEAEKAEAAKISKEKVSKTPEVSKVVSETKSEGGNEVQKKTSTKVPMKTSARGFPRIGEDVERTKKLVKKAEEAKEANRPSFPKIGGK